MRASENNSRERFLPAAPIDARSAGSFANFSMASAKAPALISVSRPLVPSTTMSEIEPTLVATIGKPACAA